jgi:LysM repeat protein
MRKWVGMIAIGVLLVALVGTTACTRSKQGPAPTLAVTGQAETTPGQTPSPGTTVVSAATATTTGETPAVKGSATPIPTMTPTPATGGVATTAPSPTPTTAATQAPTTTGGGFEYIVKTGDTLWGLAYRFGTTVEAIKARNGLTSNIIYKGQTLIIPGTAGGGEQITHIVQPGENLFRIALKYGTTVEAIAAANNIINPNLVYAGQKLIIVKGSGAVPGGGVRYHVVQPGETLWSIAMRYGTTPWKIAAANGIANINFIYAGRTLRIPG